MLGDEDLARAGARATRAPMWTAIPATLPSGELALAGVEAGADLQAELAALLAIARRSGSRAPGRRSVAKKPSPAVSSSHAAEARELAADGRVVRSRSSRQRAVAQLGRPLGRADDVGEQDGGEHAVGLRLPRAALAAPRETLDLVEDGSLSPSQGRWSAPGSSTSRAPGIRSAM